MKFLGKLAVLFALAAAPVFADGLVNFAFTTNAGDIGKTDTVTMGVDTLMLTGYSAPLLLEDLFAKNTGPTETGIGLVSEPDHEISKGSDFIQIDMTKIFDIHAVSMTIGINSIQPGESYAVWGSHIAGSLGTLIATGQTNPTFTLPDIGAFDFISITASSGNVLIDDIAVNTPEPSSLLLLGLGLGVLVAAGILAKK